MQQLAGLITESEYRESVSREFKIGDEVKYNGKVYYIMAVDEDEHIFDSHKESDEDLLKLFAASGTGATKDNFAVLSKDKIVSYDYTPAPDETISELKNKNWIVVKSSDLTK